MRTAKAGFTLIELAVVVTIIAILSSAAIPKMMTLITRAEHVMAQDLALELTTAQGLYVANTLSTPTSFLDFVETDSEVADGDKTISLYKFGKYAGGCEITSDGTEIDCSNAFDKTTAVYSLDEDGVIYSDVESM